jgi:hypothetical protein
VLNAGKDTSFASSFGAPGDEVRCNIFPFFIHFLSCAERGTLFEFVVRDLVQDLFWLFSSLAYSNGHRFLVKFLALASLRVLQCFFVRKLWR